MGFVTIRVFLLDDHELVREGIRSLLESDEDIEVVGEAATAEEALIRIPLAKPDVAILDVRLEDGSGIDVCRDVRSLMPGLVCLMLTSFADDEALYASVMAGAAGYVLKQIKARDLIEDVKQVAGGASLMDPRAVARVVERISNPPTVNPELKALSPRGPHLGPDCRGTNKPSGSRSHVPIGEDRQELHDGSPGQAKDELQDRSGDLRHQTQGERVRGDSGLRIHSPAGEGSKIDARASQLVLKTPPLLLAMGEP